MYSLILNLFPLFPLIRLRLMTLQIRGRLNSKIYTVVDVLGNSIAFLLSAGTDADSTHTIKLLSHLPIENSNILGDNAHDTQKIK